MDMVVWYVILTILSIGVAIGVRMAVYTILVKNSRWLPEKATKMANLTSGITIAVAIVAILGKALITH